MGMPGHGKSGIHMEDADLDTLLQSVVDVIGHTHPSENILLVGNSLGGLVAIRVALAMPGRIAALCLLSPASAPLSKNELQDVKQLFQLQTH